MFYYLVDSTFPCTTGFMAPYLRVWYHRDAYHGEPLFIRYQHYFNFLNDSLCNVIKRIFDVKNKRFQILRLYCHLTRQQYIVVACYTLYNVVCMATPNDKILHP